MIYKYEEPAGKKYTISVRDWNKVFAKRGRWPFVKVEVYVQEDQATCQYVTSEIGRVTMVFISPLFYVYGIALQGLKETHEDFKDVLFNKSRGAFSSDVIYKVHEKGWNKLMALIEEHGK